jgi:catechol 2,3-dioxygenase-like lactoylglutathione lyase family enzyme
MPIKDIHHVAIKTRDLEKTIDFCVKVLGMTVSDKRPNLPFDGAWVDFNRTQFHLYAGDVAHDEDGTFHHGTGAIDHVALEAQGFDEIKKTVLDYGAEWRQNRAPTGGLWQLFVKDPSGVTFELNFPTAGEPEGSAGPDDTNRYVTGRF